MVKLIGISQCRSSPSRWKTGLLDVDLDVEIAGGAAIDARFALAAVAQAHAVVDAGGDLHFQGLLALDATGAAAGGAGLGMIRPLPWHLGQVCWIEKKPCWMRTWTRAPRRWGRSWAGCRVWRRCRGRCRILPGRGCGWSFRRRGRLLRG